MQDFIKELPALIITIAVLAMVTIFLLLGHVAIGDIVTIVSPVIAFWFMGTAFKWSPVPTQPPATPLQGVSTPQEKAS